MLRINYSQSDVNRALDNVQQSRLGSLSFYLRQILSTNAERGLSIVLRRVPKKIYPKSARNIPQYIQVTI